MKDIIKDTISKTILFDNNDFSLSVGREKNKNNKTDILRVRSKRNFYLKK
jgi:hypothetical protein